MERLLKLVPMSKDGAQVRREILQALEPWQGRPKSLKACIERYFERIDSRLVSRIENSVQELPVMDSSVQAVVCMPVVAFGDQDTESMLRCLRLLELADTYDVYSEVLVLPNWPSRALPDRTADVARQLNFVHIPIIVAPTELALEEQSAGYYRALMHGITLLRTLRRGGDDVVHITLDADTISIPRGYVRTYVNVLQEEPKVDAVIGQLDWDNVTIPTSRVPELFVGNELMRLLPKYGNWQVLSEPENYPEELVQECTFSRRSFGRGVQANLAWKGFAYARVGGYRPEAHDELDFILRKIATVGGLRNLAFGWDEVGVLSDSRRALWALKKRGMPPMRQWSVPFEASDFVRSALPDMANHIGYISTITLERQINLTLEVFNLPAKALRKAVTASLSEIGLAHDDYKLSITPYEADPILSVAQIRIVSYEGFRTNIIAQTDPH